MTVQRLGKYQSEDPFTRVPNAAVRDDRLDLKARGLLLLMLSKPDDWRFTEANLARDAGVGRDQLRTAIASLIDAGYVHRWWHTEGDRPIHRTSVSDVSMTDEEWGTVLNPESGTSGFGKPHYGETQPGSNEVEGTNEVQSTNEGETKAALAAVDDVPRHQRDPEDVWSPEVIDTTREVAKMIRQAGHALPTAKTKRADSWYEAIDRLLRLGPPGDTGDDPPPTPQEVIDVARWALVVSDFWPANVRSATKLREAWTQLQGQQRRNTNGRREQTSDTAYADVFTRLAEREGQS